MGDLEAKWVTMASRMGDWDRRMGDAKGRMGDVEAEWAIAHSANAWPNER